MKKGAGAVAAWLVQLAGADDLLAVHDISKRKKESRATPALVGPKLSSLLLVIYQETPQSGPYWA